MVEPTKSPPFFTVGHSTRSIEEFVELVRSAGVHSVADVRTVPRSRTNPQFNRDTLPEALSEFQIGYEHIPQLGGLRSGSRDVPPTVNAFWQNQSFTTMPTTRWAKGFEKALRVYVILIAAYQRRSCARRRYGGDVIGASSLTT
jgi:uncharacterized protein (DUF488 family)